MNNTETAMFVSYEEWWRYGAGNGYRWVIKLGFDASRVNSIYGNSNTVQPPALTVKMLIKY